MNREYHSKSDVVIIIKFLKWCEEFSFHIRIVLLFIKLILIDLSTYFAFDCLNMLLQNGFFFFLVYFFSVVLFLKYVFSEKRSIVRTWWPFSCFGCNPIYSKYPHSAHSYDGCEWTVNGCNNLLFRSSFFYCC